jgi:hypothetical protein
MCILVVWLDLLCGLGPCWLTETPTGLDPSGVGLPRETSAIGWFVPLPPGVLVFTLPCGPGRRGGGFNITEFTICTTFSNTRGL